MEPMPDPVGPCLDVRGRGTGQPSGLGEPSRKAAEVLRGRQAGQGRLSGSFSSFSSPVGLN